MLQSNVRRERLPHLVLLLVKPAYLTLAPSWKEREDIYSTVIPQVLANTVRCQTQVRSWMGSTSFIRLAGLGDTSVFSRSSQPLALH